MNKVYFSLVVIVTIMALTVSCTTSDDEESTSSPNSDLSSCGQTVLSYHLTHIEIVFLAILVMVLVKLVVFIWMKAVLKVVMTV